MSFALDASTCCCMPRRGSRYSSRAIDFLSRCVAGPEVCCIAWTTVMSYVRISTHSAIFANPLSPEGVTANVEALLRVPHVRVLSEEDGFWHVFRDVTAGLAVRGNAVPDAHLAAVLKQHGVVTLYTSDSDFRKF